MKAWPLNEFGSLRSIQIEDVPEPEPREGEVVIKVLFAALNPADIFQIVGHYPGVGELPVILGRDGCGVVVSDSPSGKFRQGDKVLLTWKAAGVTRNGTLADYVSVPEDNLVSLPSGWTPEEGAAATLVHLTAWQALVEDGRINENSNVLITGASGGVGSAALMQAKSWGAKVVALSRNAEKSQRLIELGADAVFRPDDPKLVKKVKEVLDGRGADIVIENIAGPAMNQSVEMCDDGGVIALIGMLGGVKVELSLPEILFRRLHVAGVFLGGMDDKWGAVVWPKIVALLESGGYRPVVDQVFAFEDLHKAFTRLRQGPMGKVLIGPIAQS